MKIGTCFSATKRLSTSLNEHHKHSRERIGCLEDADERAWIPDTQHEFVAADKELGRHTVVCCHVTLQVNQIEGSAVHCPSHFRHPPNGG